MVLKGSKGVREQGRFRRKERCQDSLHQVNQPRAANKQREDELQEWLNKYMLEATEDLRRDMEVMRKDMEVMHRNMDSSFEDMKTALGEYQDGVSETRCELRDIQDELEDFQDKLRAIQDETKDCEDMLESVQSELKVVNAGIERVEHGLNGVQNDLKVANDNMELVKEGTKELVKAEERNFKIQQMKNMEMAVGLAELADRLGIDTSGPLDGLRPCLGSRARNESLHIYKYLC
ncbi:hypothetical protein CPC08DRAFT_549614 [Agrocybe pediades]|nr:hypothetical protein CPC08DRAFT_549614 [Agrocybe pediades]